MNLSDHIPFSIRSEDTSVEVRCYSYGLAGSEFAYAIIAGPEQSCQAVFSNLVKRQCLIFADGDRVNLNDFQVRRSAGRISPANTRWVTMLITSKDPAVLLQDDDASLIVGLKRMTETPFLDSWINYIRSQLTELGLLVKLKGHATQGSYLLVDSDKLDEIVGEGLRAGRITMVA